MRKIRLTMLAGCALLLLTTAAAQVRFEKTGVADSSTIMVRCDDVYAGRLPSDFDNITRWLKTNIIIKCVATASRGAGSIRPVDFSWQYKYGPDTKVRTFRDSDSYGDWGEVFGTVERVFYLGLPDTKRPEVIILHLGETSGTIVFSSF